MDIDTFRENFPEFASEVNYPEEIVQFWSDIAEEMVLEKRWSTFKPKGVMLFTAHHLVIAKSNVDSSNAGGLPGQISGPTASKTVGAASVSYDTNAGLELNAGHWNLTTYGKMFIHLARMFGAGAVQL